MITDLMGCRVQYTLKRKWGINSYVDDPHFGNEGVIVGIYINTDGMVFVVELDSGNLIEGRCYKWTLIK